MLTFHAYVSNQLCHTKINTPIHGQSHCWFTCAHLAVKQHTDLWLVNKLTQVNVSKWSTPNLPPESVFTTNPKLHAWNTKVTKFQETKSTQNGISVERQWKVKWSLEGRRMVSLASGNPTNKSAIHRTLRSSLQLASLANLNSGTTQSSSLEAYTRPQKSNARLPNYVNRVNACSRVCLWRPRVHSSSSFRVHLGNTIKLPPSFTRRNKRVTMKIRQRQEA